MSAASEKRAFCKIFKSNDLHADPAAGPGAGAPQKTPRGLSLTSTRLRARSAMIVSR